MTSVFSSLGIAHDDGVPRELRFARSPGDLSKPAFPQHRIALGVDFRVCESSVGNGETG